MVVNFLHYFLCRDAEIKPFFDLPPSWLYENRRISKQKNYCNWRSCITPNIGASEILEKWHKNKKNRETTNIRAPMLMLSWRSLFLKRYRFQKQKEFKGNNVQNLTWSLLFYHPTRFTTVPTDVLPTILIFCLMHIHFEEIGSVIFWKCWILNLNVSLQSSAQAWRIEEK